MSGWGGLGRARVRRGPGGPGRRAAVACRGSALVLLLGVACLPAGVAWGEALPSLLAVEPVVQGEGADRIPGPGNLERRGPGGPLRMRPLAAGDPRRRLLDSLAASAPLQEVRRWIHRARAAGRAGGGATPLLVAVPERFVPQGPSYLYATPAEVTDAPGARAPGLVLLAPMPTPQGPLSVEDQHAAGLLPAALVHELVHLAMAEGYGEQAYLELQARTEPFVRHAAPVVSDPHTAWVEGLAEAAERWLEERFPGQVYPPPAPDAPATGRALREQLVERRLEATRHNRYVYAADGRRRDGELDSGEDALRTEGVVATLLVRLARELPGGFGELLELAVRHRPADLEGLLGVLGRERPAQRRLFERVVLEATRYSVYSPAAARHYRSYYRARRAFLRGEGTREAAEAARRGWQAWRDTQRERIAAGRSPWSALDRPVPVTLPDGTSADLQAGAPEALLPLMIRLRDQLASGMPSLPPPRLLVARLLRARRTLGRLASAEDLRGALPDPLVDALVLAEAEARAAAGQRLRALVERLRARRRRLAFLGADPRFLAPDPVNPDPAAHPAGRDPIGPEPHDA